MKSFAKTATAIAVLCGIHQADTQKLAAHWSTARFALCDSVQSSESRRISHDAEPFPGRFPSIAVAGGRWIVAANSLEKFSAAMKRQTYVVKSESGWSWTSPESASALLPQVIPSGADLDILFAGVPRELDVSGWSWPPPTNSVWLQRLSVMGVPRSAPELLFRSDIVHWDDASRSEVVLTSDGTSHVLFMATSPKRGRFLVLASRLKSGWKTREIDTDLTPAYVSLAAIGDTLVAGLIAGAPGQGHDVNSVWVMRSTDRGGSWNRPVLVSRSGIREANLIAAVTYQSHVHVFWGQNLAGGSAPEVIRHVQFDAKRDTVGTSTDFALEHQPWRMSALATSCGVLISVIDYSPPHQTQGVLVLDWTNDHWSSQRLLTDYVVELGRLASGPRGLSEMVWSGKSVTIQPRSGYELRIASLRVLSSGRRGPSSEVKHKPPENQ